jgi:hypothetical protein
MNTIPELEKARDFLVIANCHNVYTDSALEIIKKVIENLKEEAKNG